MGPYKVGHHSHQLITFANGNSQYSQGRLCSLPTTTCGNRTLCEVLGKTPESNFDTFIESSTRHTLTCCGRVSKTVW
jgi:hypothetical protein